MNFLSWNYRRLGNPQIVHDIYQMVKKKSPKIVFLMETLISKHRIEVVKKIKKKMGFYECFMVDLIGRIGGLAILWKQEVDFFHIANFSLKHITRWFKMHDQFTR